MSKHRNYTNYTAASNNIQSNTEITPEENSVILETPKTIMGVVSACQKLNIRTKPTSEAEIEAVVPVGTKVQIDLENSTDDFYNVCTEAGIEGYCMKQFVDIEE